MPRDKGGMERRLFSEPGLKVIFLRDASTRKGRQFRTRTSLVKLKIAPYELPRRDTIHAVRLFFPIPWIGKEIFRARGVNFFLFELVSKYFKSEFNEWTDERDYLFRDYSR